MSYLFEYFGILTFLYMIGFCVCRCCGRCGGKITLYRRRPLMKMCLIGFVIFGTIILVLGGTAALVGT